MLDTHLPEKIQRAYTQWCEENHKGKFADSRESYYAFAVFLIGTGVLAASMLVPSLRDAHRKRKTHAEPEKEE